VPSAAIRNWACGAPPAQVPAHPPQQPTSQEFDAAEEICRFAAPLLASAAARRL
jgi:hypothetical protein